MPTGTNIMERDINFLVYNESGLCSRPESSWVLDQRQSVRGDHELFVGWDHHGNWVAVFGDHLRCQSVLRSSRRLRVTEDGQMLQNHFTDQIGVLTDAAGEDDGVNALRNGVRSHVLSQTVAEYFQCQVQPF